MTDTDFPQPSPGRPHAAAEAAGLAEAVSGLLSIDGCRLAGDDPLAPLARAAACSLAGAGLPLHGIRTSSQQAMNTAIGGNLRAFRNPPGPFGSGSAWFMTGTGGQGPGAGR